MSLVRWSKTHNDHESSGEAADWWDEFCDAELQQSVLSPSLTIFMVQEDRGRWCEGGGPSEVHSVFKPAGVLLLRRGKWNWSKSVWANPAVWWWVNSRLWVCMWTVQYIAFLQETCFAISKNQKNTLFPLIKSEQFENTVPRSVSIYWCFVSSNHRTP